MYFLSVEVIPNFMKQHIVCANITQAHVILILHLFLSAVGRGGGGGECERCSCCFMLWFGSVSVTA